MLSSVGCRLEPVHRESPAIQYSNGQVTGSEASLNLDVVRPDTKKKNLPVLVYIHGGNNQTGTAQEIKGNSFVKDLNAVYVSVNYRLGVLGFNPLAAVIISMGIFYGGIAQVIAGIIAFKRSNIFAATAFTSYGFFWITLVGIWMLPDTGNALAGATPNSFLGIYLALWGIFTAFMLFGTWGASKVQQFVFLSLTVLFFQR